MNKAALLAGLLNDLLLIIESEDYSMLKEYKNDITTLLNEEGE
jgi:hypothetical protein